MEKNLDETPNNGGPYRAETESEQSFVGKFKSMISHTPLGKWFKKEDDHQTYPALKRPTTSTNPDDDDQDDPAQPPAKKPKLPTTSYRSSFPEPIAGPSGMQNYGSSSGISHPVYHVPYGNAVYNGGDVINGHNKDSDSEESTSGYSSAARIGSKEVLCENWPGSMQVSASPTRDATMMSNSKLLMSRSLFLEKSSRSPRNKSLSSRRPSFNATSFNSTNQSDATFSPRNPSISPRNIINSPFYTGKTIYGGASAYGQKFCMSPKQIPTKITPVNDTLKKNVTLGRTAKRILETLEQYNSPINDVKKIPTVSRKQDGGMLKKFIGANPYTVPKELQVPTVADLLKIKKNLLQHSTEAVREIATSSKSVLNSESYKLGGVEEKNKNNVGKMKRKISAVRHKVTNEVPAEVNLPSVALPIGKLPKFDVIPEIIQIPDPVPACKVSVDNPKTVIKETEKVVRNYKFSEPLIIAENIKSIVKLNNFKFSEPVSKKFKAIGNAVNFKMPGNGNVVNFKMPENRLPILKAKNNGESYNKNVLKSGSVMEILGKQTQNDPEISETPKRASPKNLMDKFKAPANTWECTICMIRNPEHKTKCAACETPKKATPKNLGTLMDKFKAPANSWECTVCMIRNPEDKAKCAACETPKKTTPKNVDTKLSSPSDRWECPVCMIRNPGDKLKCAACEAPKKNAPKNFDNFKLPSDRWQCPTCTVHNNNSDLKCVACSAPKQPAPTGTLKIQPETWKCPTCFIQSVNPLKKCATCDTPKNTFGAKFKPPEKSWECSACLVRNMEHVTKCVACETPKSGSKIGNGFGASFGLKDDQWECSVCMVRNQSQNLKCQCCEASKPGGNLNIEKDDKIIAPFNLGVSKNPTTSFTFGIPPSSKIESPKLDQSIFGGNSSKILPTTTTTTDFTFGIPSTSSENDNKSTPNAKVPVAPPSDNIDPATAPNAKVPVAPSSDKPFNFAVTKKPPDDATIAQDPKPPAFNFKPSGSSNLFQDVPKESLFQFGSKQPATAPAAAPSTKEDAQPVSSTSLFKFSLGGATASFGASGVSSTNSNAFDVKIKTTDFKPPTESKPQQTAIVATESRTVPFSSQQSATVANSSTSDVKSSSTPIGGGFNFPAPTTFNFTSAQKGPSAQSPFAAALAQSGFNFGGAAAQSVATPKAGFNFGASSSAPQAAGFNFGAVASTTSASTSAPGGFNFSAATANFNPNIKPTFNFSESPITSFSAQVSGDGLPAPRKIKRAVRRTQR